MGGCTHVEFNLQNTDAPFRSCDWPRNVKMVYVTMTAPF